jgi:hypothetical protein
MQIDLAGIAKGYAVDRCVSVLAGVAALFALPGENGIVYRAAGDIGRRLALKNARVFQ